MATSPEFKIISSLGHPGASVGAAIQRLLALTSAAAATTTESTVWSDNPLWIHLENTWLALTEEVAPSTAPSDQAALIEFIRVLRKQEVVDPTTGRPLRYVVGEDWIRTFWTELPILEIITRDNWGYDDRLSEDPGYDTRYLNKLAFMAQLTNLPENDTWDSHNNGGPLDFSLFAIWDLRHAFENPHGEEENGDFSLRSAAVWMIYCADRLWKHVQAKRRYVDKVSGTCWAAAGSLYYKKKKHWTGYNKERWDIWVDGFESNKNVQDEDLRQLVLRALEQVERVTDQSWRITEDEKFM